MTKEYETPEMEIEKFSVPDTIFTASGNLGEGNEDIDPWARDF